MYTTMHDLNDWIFNSLPEAIFEMLVTENNKKAKIMIFHRPFPIIIGLQYLPLNVCFCKWYILMN